MRNFISVLLVLSSVAVAAPALADLPPPDTAGCNGKAAGAACLKDDMMTNGTCVDSICTKLDYSDGSPPGTIEVPCLVCTSSSSGSSSSSSSSGSSSSSSGSSAQNGDTSEDSGCSVRHGGMAGALGAWVLGATVLLLSRRKRARARTPRP